MYSFDLNITYRQGKFRGWFSAALCHFPVGKSRMAIMPATSFSMSFEHVYTCLNDASFMHVYTCLNDAYFKHDNTG